jgi:hypothetical protein
MYSFAPDIGWLSGEILQVNYHHCLTGSVIDGVWVRKQLSPQDRGYDDLPPALMPLALSWQRLPSPGKDRSLSAKATPSLLIVNRDVSEALQD